MDQQDFLDHREKQWAWLLGIQCIQVVGDTRL